MKNVRAKTVQHGRSKIHLVYHIHQPATVICQNAAMNDLVQRLKLCWPEFWPAQLSN
jgi:hypothetical protein